MHQTSFQIFKNSVKQQIRALCQAGGAQYLLHHEWALSSGYHIPLDGWRLASRVCFRTVITNAVNLERCNCIGPIPIEAPIDLTGGSDQRRLVTRHHLSANIVTAKLFSYLFLPERSYSLVPRSSIMRNMQKIYFQIFKKSLKRQIRARAVLMNYSYIDVMYITRRICGGVYKGVADRYTGHQ